MAETGTSRVSPYCDVKDYEVECDIRYLKSVERPLSSIEVGQLSVYRDNCPICRWLLSHVESARVISCREYSTYYKYGSLSIRLEWHDLTGRFDIVYGAGRLYSLLSERSIGVVLEWSYNHLEFIPVVLDGLCSYRVFVNTASMMPVATLGRNILRSSDKRIVEYLLESKCNICENMLYYVYSSGSGVLSIKEARS